MGAKPKKNGSISYAKWGYIFIAPFFLIFAVFQLIHWGLRSITAFLNITAAA